MSILKIPDAPRSIQKGFPLKMVLGEDAISQLAENSHIVYSDFDKEGFVRDTMNGIDDLSITERSNHISDFMRKYLPDNYDESIEIILKTLTPPLTKTEENGLAPMFYMPHCSFIAKYGVDSFDVSIAAQYELTKRFTCEFSIRSFIMADETKTMEVLYKWTDDVDPHVRRLTTEGTRPRLPWSKKIDSFVKDPTPSLQILEKLKDDEDLYVRRSVANHVGDIAKDHMDLALNLCENWLDGASRELKWVIRHALRNPYKKGNERAIELRKAAK